MPEDTKAASQQSQPQTSRPPAFDPKHAREEMTPARRAALDREQLFIDKDPQAALYKFAGHTGPRTIEGMRLAVEAGADINAKNRCTINHGFPAPSALFVVANIGDPAALEAAVKLGGKINSRGDGGNTVVHEATRRFIPDTLEMAVKLGGKINARDDDGNTAVIEAARFGCPAMLKAVVRLGGDLNAMNKDGETALSVAKDSGHTDIVRAIRGLQWDQHIKSLENSFAGPLLKPVIKAFHWLDGR